MLAWSLRLCVVMVVWASGGGCSQSGADRPLKVATAASLAGAFEVVAQKFTEESGTKVSLVVSSSGKLTQQIQEGAPYDVFASADLSYLEQLVAADEIDRDSVAVYAIGRLAIWVKSGEAPTDLSVLTSKTYEHIAIANPEHAPYGSAARQALQAKGLWTDLESRIVRGSNVRQAMQYTESGNAEVGLIALSLALHGGGSYVLVDQSLHEPLEQGIAVVKGSSKKAQARAFVAFLTSETGRELLEPYGLQATQR